MAGTLTISTLSDGTNSTSATNPIRGSARAWVNFDGTGTPAIRASYNVSSITDNGTGYYTINFTSALPDANYSAVVSASPNTGGNLPVISTFGTNSGPTYQTAPLASSFTVYITNLGAVAIDVPYILASVFD